MFERVDLVAGAFGIACSILLWLRLRTGGKVSVTTHWGGLGGGTAGWRVSEALVLLIAAVFFWVLAGAFAIYRSQLVRTDNAIERQEKRDVAQIARDERHRAEDRADRDADHARGAQPASQAPSASTATSAPPALLNSSTAASTRPSPPRAPGPPPAHAPAPTTAPARSP
jgi:hypothetical protein